MLPILNMLNQIGSTEVVKAYGLPALIAELAECVFRPIVNSHSGAT